MNAPDIETTLRARAAFNASVEHLDDDTRRRLRAARLRALAPKKALAHGHRWLWPAGAALAAALAIVVVLPRMTPVPIVAQPIVSTAADAASSAAPPSAIAATATVVATSATSPQVIATATPIKSAVASNTAHETLDASTVDTADPDMLDQLDFYGWLAQQPDSGHGGG